MSFIDDIKEATKEVETPWSFIHWACLAATSAVVKNNVYFNKGGVYNLYANIYAMIIGKSGLRKGFAAWIARELVSGVKNTKILQGQNSIQGVLEDLRNTQTSENGGGPSIGSQALLISEEFSTFLIEDPSAYNLLTTLYDTHHWEKHPWEKKLRDIKYVIKNPCLTLLGASNMTLLEEVIPKSAYEGGFVGRLMVIYEEKRRVKNSLVKTKQSSGIQDAISKAIDALKIISTKRGQFALSAAGTQFYDDWYQSFDSEAKNDSTGFVERIHEHILKIAMLVSLINRGDMLIEDTDIREAMDLCFSARRDIGKLAGGRGKSPLGQQTKLVLMTLFSRPDHKVTREELLRKHYGEFSANDLEAIQTTLINANAITVSMKGNKVVYELKQDMIEYFQNMEKESGKSD